MNKNILEQLENKAITADELVKQVRKDFDLLAEIYNGISSSKAHVRYPCAKVLTILSGEEPEKLYPKMDFFITLLDSDKRILLWNALNIIANLTDVDEEKKFDKIFDKYFGFIDDEYMVTVVNVIGNAGKIARAKPYLTQRITKELLRVENLPLKSHLTLECRNIILGQVISSFEMYFDQIEDKDEILSLVRRQRVNTRNSTRAEAETFLKKFGDVF